MCKSHGPNVEMLITLRARSQMSLLHKSIMQTFDDAEMWVMELIEYVRQNTWLYNDAADDEDIAAGLLKYVIGDKSEFDEVNNKGNN